MIVECFGLPGSGKTFFLQAIFSSPSVTHERIKIEKRFERVGWALLGCLRYPRIAAAFLRAISQQPRSLRRYIFHLWSKSFAETVQGRLRQYLYPHRTFFLDEGLLQRTLSLCDSPAFSRLWSRVQVFCAKHVCLVFYGGTFKRFEVGQDASASPRVQMGPVYLATWRRSMREAFQEAVQTVVRTQRSIQITRAVEPDWSDALTRVREGRF